MGRGRGVDNRPAWLKEQAAPVAPSPAEYTGDAYGAPKNPDSRPVRPRGAARSTRFDEPPPLPVNAEPPHGLSRPPPPQFPQQQQRGAWHAVDASVPGAAPYRPPPTPAYEPPPQQPSFSDAIRAAATTGRLAAPQTYRPTPQQQWYAQTQQQPPLWSLGDPLAAPDPNAPAPLVRPDQIKGTLGARIAKERQHRPEMTMGARIQAETRRPDLVPIRDQLGATADDPVWMRAPPPPVPQQAYAPPAPAPAWPAAPPVQAP